MYKVLVSSHPCQHLLFSGFGVFICSLVVTVVGFLFACLLAFNGGHSNSSEFSLES